MSPKLNPCPFPMRPSYLIFQWGPLHMGSSPLLFSPWSPAHVLFIWLPFVWSLSMSPNAWFHMTSFCLILVFRWLLCDICFSYDFRLSYFSHMVSISVLFTSKCYIILAKIQVMVLPLHVYCICKWKDILNGTK